ncbi:hypothetical protein NWFMUON74_67960 [Nocardia wallacei]|uniref:Uncharacterized protein n=1 Tax=Nocardia wallacei TaxID=480035 RepID=A0A7G1L0X9_9NOCA|nr:hypothetical protein NWFMUON74_67960 [Nocardia wallacei]
MSAASKARGFGPPTGTGTPSTSNCTGPRTRTSKLMDPYLTRSVPTRRPWVWHRPETLAAPAHRNLPSSQHRGNGNERGPESAYSALTDLPADFRSLQASTTRSAIEVSAFFR